MIYIFNLLLIIGLFGFLITIAPKFQSMTKVQQFFLLLSLVATIGIVLFDTNYADFFSGFLDELRG